MKTILTTLFFALTSSAGTAFAGVNDEVRATFDRFVAAQNAHDVSAVRDLLLDSPDFLWITRGAPIWGRDAALMRFEALYQGTWKLSPDTSNLKVVAFNSKTAQLFVPIIYSIGPAGQPAPDAPFIMNQTLVKTGKGWRIANIIPVPVPPPAPVSAR